VLALTLPRLKLLAHAFAVLLLLCTPRSRSSDVEFASGLTIISA